MAMPYSGPLRTEPLAIELHNTIYATAVGRVDGLANPDQARAWLQALAPRLPRGIDGEGAPPMLAAIIDLRTAVRAALGAAIDARGHQPAMLAAINRASSRAPRSAVARWRTDGAQPVRGTDFHGASSADIVVAALAEDAIDLLTSPARDDLRRCGAPGCVLIFLREHPRREWCSNACGNRARQARHYERRKQHGAWPA